MGIKFWPLLKSCCLSSALHPLLQLGELITQGSSAASQALSRPGDWVRPHRTHSQVHSLWHSTASLFIYVFLVLNTLIHVCDEQELQEAGRGYQPSYNVLPQTFNTIPGVSQQETKFFFPDEFPKILWIFFCWLCSPLLLPGDMWCRPVMSQCFT